MRVWTSTEGRQLRASLLRAEGGEVALKLESGREARFALSRLSKADQLYIGELQARGAALDLAELPERTEISREIEVSGGPRTFQTPHFEFETDQNVSRAFISEASRVFEGTYLAVQSLPHGLSFAPPAGRTHFRGKFMNDAAFASALPEGMAGTVPGQRVMGLYSISTQELLVPYSSIGARTLGSRQTLRKSSDTSTLVHEIVHQVMHSWLPVMPIWFSEGIAEYFAAVPYQNGRFEFDNAERGLSERLRGHYGVSGRTIEDVERPGSRFVGNAARQGLTAAPGPDSGEGGARTGLAGMERQSTGQDDPIPWSGTMRDYRDAMLLLYYFVHLENPGEPGRSVGNYFRLIDKAMEDTERVREEYVRYEAKRKAYNAEVQRYNEGLRSFRVEVEQYNDRVELYNKQVNEGLPAEQRVEVGEVPAAPVSPEELSLPDSLGEAARTGSINLVAMVQEKALPALLENRSAEELDEAVKKAFAEIGWEIQYRW